MRKIHYIITGGALCLASSVFAIWKINSKKNENSSEQLAPAMEQGEIQKESSNEEEKQNTIEEKKFPVKAEIKSLTYSETWDVSPEKKAIDIKIDYLVIENKNNSKEIDNLNKSLKEEAHKRFNEVKKDLKEYLESYKENEKKYKREIDCNVVFICEETSEITKNNENGIISILCRNYWYAGGVVTISYNSFVLDCNTGKKLSIFDVIQGEEMKIREMVGREIDKSDWAKKVKEYRSEDGAPINDPYSNFIDMFTINGFGDDGNSLYDLRNQPFHLKDKYLVIDFDKYDLGAGDLRAPIFEISYDTIKKYGLSIDNKFN